MYKIIRNIVGLAMLLSGIWLSSCNKTYNVLDNGSDYTINSQAEAAKFNVNSDIRSLTISGEDITDISTLSFKSIKNLIIKNTGIQTLNLSNLSSVTVSLQISDNSNLTAISGFNNLKFINGTVIIDNNAVLMDISGFMNLKTFIGSLNITNNVILGEDMPNAGDYTYGLFPVKYLSENNIIKGTVTLANNHPKAATTVSFIGHMGAGTVIDYSINSRSDVEAFMPSNDTVKNLTIKGAEITDALYRSLATKFKVVRGTVTIENTSITTSEGFFDVVQCLGGIILKDNQSNGGLFNINGFKAYTKIGGDLVVDNCPGVTHWGPGTCFAQIVTIDGSLRVLGGQMASSAFASLSAIGGDFEISNCNKVDFWNLSDGVLRTIGGDIIYTDNNKVNGLAGLDKLTHIGGNITIARNGSPVESIGEIPGQSIPGRPGFCVVKAWVEDGIVASTAIITLSLSTGTAVDLNNISACGAEKPSYTINGLAELNLFTGSANPDKKEIVTNLTITGGDITDNAISLVQTRVAEVRGIVTWDGLGLITTTENFFEKFPCKGGIIIKNMPSLNNVNAFKGYSEIGGDLVFENCPNIPTAAWGEGNCLSRITKVMGNLKMSGVNADISGVTFKSLLEVGGNFEASNNNGNFWNFAGMNIKIIGGNLIIKDNAKVNGLGGFTSIESIGGNVTILDNGSDMPLNSTSNQVGLCLIKNFKDSGKIKSSATIVLGTTSSPVEVDSLTPCQQ